MSAKEWAGFSCHTKAYDSTTHLVRHIKQLLQARHPDWKVFYCTDDLGYLSKKTLECHVAKSHAFFCFLDDKTFDSPWCPDEIRAAVDHGVPIRVIVDHDKFPDVGQLIAHWQKKEPDVAKIVFGSDSYPAILFSWKLTAQGQLALCQIEAFISEAMLPTQVPQCSTVGCSRDTSNDLARELGRHFNGVQDQLNRLETSLQTVIPLIQAKTKNSVTKALEEKTSTLKQNMTEKIKEMFGTIANQRPGSQFVQGFTLLQAPDPKAIKENPHLKHVAKQQYWETPVSQQKLLQESVRKYVHCDVQDLLLGYQLDAETLKNKVMIQLRDEMVKSVQESVAGTEEIIGLTTMHQSDVALRPSLLKYPDEDYGHETAITKKKRTWHTLWLFPMNCKVGEVCLVTLQSAEDGLLKGLATGEETLVQMAADAMQEQIHKQFDEFAEKIKTSLQNHVIDVRREVQRLKSEEPKLKASKATPLLQQRLALW